MKRIACLAYSRMSAVKIFDNTAYPSVLACTTASSTTIPSSGRSALRLLLAVAGGPSRKRGWSSIRRHHCHSINHCVSQLTLTTCFFLPSRLSDALSLSEDGSLLLSSNQTEGAGDRYDVDRRKAISRVNQVADDYDNQSVSIVALEVQ